MAEAAGFAGLPALLARISPVLETSSPEVAPADDTPPLSRAIASLRVERARRKRRNLALLVSSVAAAAAIVVLAVGTAGTPVENDRGREAAEGSVSWELVSASGISSGRTTLHERAWGSAVDLELVELPPGQEFTAWLVDESGETREAATWASTQDGAAQLQGAVPFRVGDIATLRVVDSNGSLLYSAEADYN